MTAMFNNFLGLERRYSAYDAARTVVLPVPYDSAASYQAGARNGPAAIIAASRHVELFDEELGAEFHRDGVATLEPVEPDLAGPAAMHERLFRIARRIVRDRKFLIALGGDHSISSALVRAVMVRHRMLSVLQIDAHCDLRDSYEGTPYSHACVMRRILDLGASIVQVGIRSVDAGESRFIKESKIPVVTARRCLTEPDWVDRSLGALAEDVYVSVDIDGFDPAFAPGTGTPEPGGLDWYQVTTLLRRVAEAKRIVGADVVEVMPLPGQVVTEFLAAKIVYKLIAYTQVAAAAGQARSGRLHARARSGSGGK